MKIICIGRNYVEHIKELNSAMPTEPVFFLKPETSLLRNNRSFRHPSFSSEIHYELELVLRISKKGYAIPAGEAMDHYDGIGLGIDFTARDMQDQAKKKGLPWAVSKGFDHSAPVSRFIPRSAFPDERKILFHLELNGNKVQNGDSSLMLYPFSEIIAHISRFMTLRPGDLVFTGTPAGVGPVRPGDLLQGYLQDELLLSCKIR